MDYIMQTSEDKLPMVRAYNDAVTDFKYPHLYGSVGSEATKVRAIAHMKATNLLYLIKARNNKLMEI